MKKTILIFSVLLLTGSFLFAQSARNGTNAASQLLVPMGAQYLGGGGATAQSMGLEGILWNPAGFDRGAEQVSAVFSRRDFIADIGINFAGIGVSFGDLGSIAATLRSFDIGEIPVTTEFNMDGTGEVFEPTFFTIGLTYSKRMADRIYVGVTGNYVREDMGRVGATGFAFDAGVQYDNFLNMENLSVGVAIRNIGTSMQYDGPGLFVNAIARGANRPITNYKVEAAEFDMPTVVDIATMYSPISNLDVGLSYTENNYGPNEYRVSGAFKLGDFATLRGSYILSEQQMYEYEDPSTGDVTEKELVNIFSGPSFGGTLNLQPLIGTGISFDYGFIPTEFFNANHVFSLRLAM